MKPKYWAIIILAALSASAGAVYYVKQPAQDLGPVVVHHETKTQSPATTTPETDFKDWNTYKNSDYGFEFKYPKGLYDDDPGCAPSYQDNKLNIDFHEFHGNECNIQFELTVNIPFGRYTKDCVEPSIIVKEINKINFKRINYCGHSLIYKTEKNGNNIIFENWNADEETFDQILSTFKFTSPQVQTDTSGWKTYASQKYGIHFKYPQNWELSEREGDLSGSIHDIDVSYGADIKSTVRVNNKLGYDFSANSISNKAIQQVTINGYAGQRYKYYKDWGNFVEMQDYVVVSVDPYVYQIDLYINDADYKNGNSLKLQDNFEQMLANIQFLKANPKALDPNVIPNNKIISSVTNWSSYKKSNAAINGDRCDGNDPQFPVLLDKVNAGNIYEKEINYHWIFYTPNYLNWSADRFIKNGFCEAGAALTVYAYPDKLIWESQCDGQECQNSKDVIDKYFQSLK